MILNAIALLQRNNVMIAHVSFPATTKKALSNKAIDEITKIAEVKGTVVFQ